MATSLPVLLGLTAGFSLGLVSTTTSRSSSEETNCATAFVSATALPLTGFLGTDLVSDTLFKLVLAEISFFTDFDEDIDDLAEEPFDSTAAVASMAWASLAIFFLVIVFKLFNRLFLLF